MASSVVFGSPPVLLELSTQSARLLPRLKLVTQLQDYVATGSHELSILSPTLRLWKSFSQGIPLLVLLDLFEQRVVTPDRPIHRLISRSLYPHCPKEELLSEYNRRVNILNLRGQLPETCNLSVRDMLVGSGEELLKIVKLSLYIVQVLDTQAPDFYTIPNDAANHRIEIFAKFIAGEETYIERLSRMKDYLYDLLLLPTSETIHYRDALNIQLGNIRGICAYHDYVFHCLQSFLVGGEHWDDLFDVTDKRYARATNSYKYYCDSYLDFRALLSNLKTKDASQSGAAEVLKMIESPISHLTTFSENLYELISFWDPREGLYEYDSLCVVLSTWSAWSQNVFEAMRTRRSLHAGDQIKHKAFLWDWEHPSNFGEYLLDDSLLVTISPVEAGAGTHRRCQFKRSKNIKIRCFVFLFKAVLLICRPRDIDDTESINVSYPIPSWDVGPALKSNSIFTVHRDENGLIATEFVTHVIKNTSECTLLITRSIDDFSSEKIALHFRGSQQLEQWSNVMQHACPNSERSGFEDSMPSLGHRVSPVRQKAGGVERDRSGRDKLISQTRSLDMPNIEPLEAVSRRVKSETHLFVLLELLRPAENRWHELRDRPTSLFNPPQLGHIRRQSNGRMVYDRVFQSSKFYWIRSIQTAPLSNAVPDLTGQVVRENQATTQYGGFAAVWKCNWNSQVGNVEVAVKVLNRRFERQGEEKTKKRLDHELAMWLRLQHDNVAPLLGICKDFDNGPFVSMVSPWYENGNLHEFIAAPRENELSLGKRMSLLSEISAGLAYLHSEDFVHGDLHSANVLINKHGTACITDFGLSRLVETEVSYLESIEGGACRWAAPEFRCSFASDIYAFGCIVLEVLSGKLPYYNLKNNADVIMELGHKRKPLRPPNDLPYLTDGMWSFANECWEDPPSNRPSASDVRSRMLLLFYRSLASHPI